MSEMGDMSEIKPLSAFERARAFRNRVVFDTLMRKQTEHDAGVRMGAISDDLQDAIQANVQKAIYVGVGVAVGTFVLGFIFGRVTS